MTQIEKNLNDKTNIFPKILDLSRNFSMSPLKKNSSKRILKIQQIMTSPKLLNVSKKNIKIPIPLNFKKLTISKTNDFLTERNNIDKESILFKKYFGEKEKKKEKFFELNTIFKTIEFSKSNKSIIKTIKKEKISSPTSFKLSRKKLKLRNSAKNFFQLKSENQKRKLILTQLTPINDNLHGEEIIDNETQEEMYDSFSDKTLEEIFILKVVTDFLRSKDNKLNQVQNKKNNFFDSLENKINFSFDIIGVPCFKNHFIKFNKMENISNNLVETGIISYLNKLRVIYQKQQDEKEEKRKLDLLKEENEKKKKLQKNKEKMEEFENAEEAFKGKIKNIKKNEKIQEIDYDIEDFFILKTMRFEGVFFAAEKEKKALNDFRHFNKKSKYRESIIKKIV